MPRPSIRTFALLCALAMVFRPGDLPGADAAAVEAGVCVVDITPPAGYRMSGYFSERLATGVANPLHAKALVLRQGQESAAFVACDIIGISPAVSANARRKAAAATGIPAGKIIIAATHSHTGPLYFGALRAHFHRLAVAKYGEDPCEKVDYPAMLASRIVQAIVDANAARGPVTFAAGFARQEGLSFNRRFHMKDGSVRFNPGVLNPDIVRAAGPIDPDVGIILARDAAGGDARAVFVNFALHLDTLGGTLYAADYPYHVEKTLRERLGKGLVLLFGTGTCGDINHIDVTRRERLKTEAIGRTLGETVARRAPHLKPIAEPCLAVRRATVRVTLQKPSGAEIAWARENMKKVGTRDLPFLQQVKAYKILALQMRESDSIFLEVQVIRLSRDVAVVALPGEVFVDLGLAIKRASSFATTLVVELCQDAPGYIPTRKAFAEGSYETVNSRVAPGGGEALRDAAIRLLKELGEG